MPAGRPTKRTPAVESEILRRLSEGEPLSRICKDPKMPSFQSVFTWERNDPEFLEASVRAREMGTHHLAQQCLEIADDPDLEPHDKRIRVDTRLRLIGKWNRKVYGDKLDVATDMNLTVEVKRFDAEDKPAGE